MIRITILPSLDSSHLAPAVDALRAGGVVGFPTETFYGLAVDPRSSAAVARVFALKRRPPDQPLPLIASDVEQVAAYVGTLTPLARRLAAHLWPGALTLVIPASPHLCGDVHLSTGKVAVRVPGDETARQFAKAAGHAITSTSANLSGAPPASTADEVAAAFGDGIAVLLDGGATVGGLPSTIVDATGEAPVLVRAGVVPWDRVLRFSK